MKKFNLIGTVRGHLQGSSTGVIFRGHLQGSVGIRNSGGIVLDAVKCRFVETCEKHQHQKDKNSTSLSMQVDELM